VFALVVSHSEEGIVEVIAPFNTQTDAEMYAKDDPNSAATSPCITFKVYPMFTPFYQSVAVGQHRTGSTAPLATIGLPPDEQH